MKKQFILRAFRRYLRTKAWIKENSLETVGLVFIAILMTLRLSGSIQVDRSPAESKNPYDHYFDHQKSYTTSVLK